MKFSNVIKSLKTQLNTKNTSELYRVLGAERQLGISLRHFQSVENGTRLPPESLVTNLFKHIRPSDKKNYIISFFNSILPESESGEILSYLEKYLSPELERKATSIWDSKTSTCYSDEQMEFLIDNPDCFKFHKKLMMYEKLPIDSVNLKKQKIESMINFELIKLSGKFVRPFNVLYRIPNTETHGAKSVSIASRYILKHIDFFLSREGDSGQSLGFGFQMVTKDNAIRIHEQVIALKKWVQSLASTAGVSESTVPLIFVGFAKSINWREIN